MSADALMAQESFSDYHLYSLGRKTTINNSQTKQVSMLEGTGIPVQKRYVVDGPNTTERLGEIFDFESHRDLPGQASLRKSSTPRRRPSAKTRITIPRTSP